MVAVVWLVVGYIALKVGFSGTQEQNTYIHVIICN